MMIYSFVHDFGRGMECSRGAACQAARRAPVKGLLNLNHKKGLQIVIHSFHRVLHRVKRLGPQRKRKKHGNQRAARKRSFAFEEKIKMVYINKKSHGMITKKEG